MTKIKSTLCALLAVAAAPGMYLAAQDSEQFTVEHADCALFGPNREAFAAPARERYLLTALTNQVMGRMARAAAAPRDTQTAAPQGIIDKYLFQAMADAGIAPAAQTNDFEFIRRVTLDLTGRIPTGLAVQTFVADPMPDKRARLIESLLASPEWVSKWTMYYGDLFKNSAFKQQVNLYAEGRNAFYKWIKDALENNKPYDQMAREIIATPGDNTWDPKEGPANWIAGGRVTGGPLQDTQDQITANVAETFLGLANLNCLLCHDGRTHLYQINLWGKNTTRYQAWQMAAFLSHTPGFTQVRPNPANQNSYYWTWTDNLKTDYQLGSTTGNRPGRGVVAGKNTVAPVYMFSGNGPKQGENYRQALAREVTADFQFSRAAVNYLWKEFFGRGLVEPANQFDPARLDPDHPPTEPDPQDPSQTWALQPSNPRLLNALAQSFIDSGFDIKGLMRQIANSNAYQLSARYAADAPPQAETLFARKLVRRLGAEEMHDSIALSSGVMPSYTVYLGQDPTNVAAGNTVLNWAMQFPETSSRGLNTPVNAFLDAFLRGNRDDNPRRGEGSLSQALDLMNDPFVMNRVRTASSGANSLINRTLNSAATDDQLVSTLFLNVLSRYPSDSEKAAALEALKAGNRKQMAEDLLWSLYNKVDFIFNY